MKSNVGAIEKIQKLYIYRTKLTLILSNPDQFISAYLWDLRKRILRYYKNWRALVTGFFILILISRPFFLSRYIPWHLGMRSSYFTVAHSAACLLIAFAGCRSAFRIKCQSQKRFFSPLFLSLCFKPKRARVYTQERGFSMEGRKGGEKDSKSDLPSGKMLYRIRFLPRAQRGIRFSSKVYFAVSVRLVEYPSRKSTWRTVTFNFLCDARNEKCVYYTFGGFSFFFYLISTPR